MKQLWCPWRIEYILGSKPDSCIFCLPTTTEEDQERLILYRGQWNFIILNKFPYANGHVMVVPFRHVMHVYDLTEEESKEHFLLVQRTAKIIQTHFSPQGMNIGANIGEAAGAGVKQHLHFHIVPRWNGDSSFMAVLDDVRIMPEHLFSTYHKLLPYFIK